MPDPAVDDGTEVSDIVSENDNEYDDAPPDEEDRMLDHALAADMDAKKKNTLRPKRKKAHRACFACQRAHLTCGDERPCIRCTKRNIASQCQDGVRKKAKYLHDAPQEALRPPLGPNYGPMVRPSGSRHHSNASDTLPVTSGFFQSPGYSNNPQTPGLGDGLSYSTQASPVSPGFHGPGASPVTQMPPQQQQLHDMMGPNINFNMIDPTAALFNFNFEGTDFTSRYGALEWEYLGHMSSGAIETPSREASISQTPVDPAYAAHVFNATPTMPQFGPIYDGNNGTAVAAAAAGLVDMMGLDHGHVGHNVGYVNNGNLQHGLPHAYAIAGPANLASPSESDHTAAASPQTANMRDTISPIMTPFPGNMGGGGGLVVAPPTTTTTTLPTPPPPPPRPNKTHRTTTSGQKSLLGKKKRDASWIYNITEPYSYKASFHNLFGYLHVRFSDDKKIHIAKQLASIRPSFMACMKALTRADLVMMEHVFQRTLFEYEAYLESNSSPAIVCRRTGEVVAVNHQFTALTGWTRDVLLGNEPNLNTNTGNIDSAPQRPHNQRDGDDFKNTNQPVFVAELLDDESVVKFYEDFALLAFEDSRGSRRRKGHLLKYRPGDRPQIQVRPEQDHQNGILSSRVTRIDGEHGISRIERDGKVECTYCWHIKRDPFDMPMMIVMNFLPAYDRTQTHVTTA